MNTQPRPSGRTPPSLPVPQGLSSVSIRTLALFSSLFLSDGYQEEPGDCWPPPCGKGWAGTVQSARCSVKAPGWVEGTVLVLGLAQRRGTGAQAQALSGRTVHWHSGSSLLSFPWKGCIFTQKLISKLLLRTVNAVLSPGQAF